MSTNKSHRRFAWLGSATLAGILALVAVAVPLTPANAQFDVQIGPFGIGVGPYYGPGPYYYGPGPYYYHHYYHRYYDGW